ncbi:MAG TPA: DoxX family membrane protein [Caulobacteraceae bacterium]
MLSVLIIFTARCLLVMLFLPFSALDKLINTKAAVAQARDAIASPAIAKALLSIGAGVEISMSLAILTGVADRLAAFIFAGYCLMTAALWKRFWRVADFRLKGESRGRDLFWDFLKNVALAGGFLMLAFGGDASGARRFFAHPLASSHPYAHVDEQGAQ